MKKVSKAILIALGVIVVVGAVLVLCVNLYIQSAGTQARIRRGLSKALHAPVKITRTSFMPWYGIKLSGIRTGEPVSPGRGKPLEIKEISAHVKLLKLIQHKVVIKELSIDGAKLTWNQTADGKWRLPQAVPTPVPQPAPGTETVPQPESQGPSQPEQQPAPEQAPTPPQVTINHFRLRDASFDFFDSRNKHIASVVGINVQSPYPSKGAVNGTASIERVMIQNLLLIEQWRTVFTYSPSRISFFDAHSFIAGGSLTGSLNISMAAPNSPFDLDVKFSDIDVDRLITGAGVSVVQASGSLGGFLKLQGDLHSSDSAVGNGRFVITNGHVAQWELFRTLGQMLRTDKLQEINLQDAFIDYHIAAGKVFVDQLLLRSSDVSLSGQGIVVINGGELFLKSRFTIGYGIARQIPDFLLDSFAADPVSKARYIDFDVTGTLGSPKTNLLKLIGKNLDYRRLEKGAGSLLKNWLNRRKPAPPPPPPTPVPAQETTPAPSPESVSSPVPVQTPAPVATP